MFDLILFKPLLNDAKLPKLRAKCFSLSKESNIFWICMRQNPNGWSEKLETWHVKTLDSFLRKKVRK